MQKEREKPPKPVRTPQPVFVVPLLHWHQEEF
jgi:hypothetical protein